MNNFKVEIYNEEKQEYEDFSKHAVFPFKCADFLDEQLDECEATLKRVSKEYFSPLTVVNITLINNPSAKFSSITAIKNRQENESVSIAHNFNKTITETYQKVFIVANDYSVEQPIGSGKYNHQLYLIEVTKILEGYIGDSISFTNALGHNYAEESSSGE